MLNVIEPSLYLCMYILTQSTIWRAFSHFSNEYIIHNSNFNSFFKHSVIFHLSAYMCWASARSYFIFHSSNTSIPAEVHVHWVCSLCLNANAALHMKQWCRSLWDLSWSTDVSSFVSHSKVLLHFWQITCTCILWRCASAARINLAGIHYNHQAWARALGSKNYMHLCASFVLEQWTI